MGMTSQLRVTTRVTPTIINVNIFVGATLAVALKMQGIYVLRSSRFQYAKSMGCI